MGFIGRKPIKELPKSPSPIESIPNLSVIIEDDFIYLVNVFNRYKQKVMMHVAPTREKADKFAAKFADTHKDDRYWTSESGKVSIAIESKAVNHPRIPRPESAIASPRE